MAAFFSIFAYGAAVLLIWKGAEIRKLSFKSLSANEGGLRVMKSAVDRKEPLTV